MIRKEIINEKEKKRRLPWMMIFLRKWFLVALIQVSKRKWKEKTKSNIFLNILYTNIHELSEIEFPV